MIKPEPFLTDWNVETTECGKYYISSICGDVCDLYFTPTGRTSLVSHENAKANAEYIVKCVNNYDAMMQELSEITHNICDMRKPDAANALMDLINKYK